jgi:hypothetical protein
MKSSTQKILGFEGVLSELRQPFLRPLWKGGTLPGTWVIHCFCRISVSPVPCRKKMSHLILSQRPFGKWDMPIARNYLSIYNGGRNFDCVLFNSSLMKSFRLLITLWFSVAAVCSTVVGQQQNKLGGEWSVEGVFDPHGSNPNAFSSARPLALIGDINHDDYPEYGLICDPNAWSEAALLLVNGLDGSSLWTFSYSSHSLFHDDPEWIVQVHDFDLDGVRDLLIGQPNHVGVSGFGVALLHSGLTGDILWSGDGDTFGAGFAQSGASIPDVNGDGILDFAVLGSGQVPGAPPGNSFVQVFSGVDGANLRTFIDAQGLTFHDEIASVDFHLDLNTDGIGDFLVESLGSNVEVISGLDGAVLYSCEDCSLSDLSRQAQVASISDTNGDGIQDFVLPVHISNPSFGGISCRSGRDGTEIWRTSGLQLDGGFGYALANAGDFNHDGIDDLFVSEPFKPVNGDSESGLIHIVDGATGDRFRKIKPSDWSLGPHHWFGYTIGFDRETQTLVTREFVPVSSIGDATLVYKFAPFMRSSASSISSSAGAVFELSLEFPDHAAGMAYSLLLSKHGYGPSDLAGERIPLTWDGLFARSLHGILPPFFANRQGWLGPIGEGSIHVVLPSNALNQMVGNTLYGCAIAFTPGVELNYVSVAVPIRVDP